MHPLCSNIYAKQIEFSYSDFVFILFIPQTLMKSIRLSNILYENQLFLNAILMVIVQIKKILKSEYMYQFKDEDLNFN